MAVNKVATPLEEMAPNDKPFVLLTNELKTNLKLYITLKIHVSFMKAVSLMHASYQLKMT